MAETDWKYLQYNVETGQKRTGDGPSGGASSLSDLDDTSISNPSDGQMLGYDGTTGKWKNVAAPAGSVTDVKLDNQSVVDQNGVAKLTTPNIDALGKTAISNPANGEMLGYDGTEGKWKNVSAPGGNVDDVKVNGTSVVSNKVANITSYKEVTQAQYEALPDTKLNDGVLYAIKDGGQAVDGFPPLIYSDEEREVGVWRDGKPLYQKTVNFGSLPDHALKSVTHGIQNLDRIINYSAVTKNSTGTTYFPLPRANDNTQYVIDIYFSNTDINIATYGDRTAHSVYVTLQYTKTTDTAGSGTWTTQGGYAHHYSTTEHIVGTWIDGKPLYEKTVTYGSVSGSSGSISLGIANVEHIALVSEGSYMNNSIPIPYVHSVQAIDVGCFFDIGTSDTTLELRIGSQTQGNINSVVVTAQYTKTTD